MCPFVNTRYTCADANNDYIISSMVRQIHNDQEMNHNNLNAQLTRIEVTGKGSQGMFTYFSSIRNT